MSMGYIGGADGPTSVFMATPWGGFGGFGLFDIIFVVVFVLVIGVFVVTLVRGIGQWHRNNQSPRLTVEAQVIAKRDAVSSHRHDGHYHHYMHYYVTFQVESGDRMELQLEGEQYGLLMKGDRGRLTFQGTRYIQFERV